MFKPIKTLSSVRKHLQKAVCSVLFIYSRAFNKYRFPTANLIAVTYCCGCSVVVVEYRTRNREVAGSTHTQSTASNLEQVAYLLCAQANSASCRQQDGKLVVAELLWATW